VPAPLPAEDSLDIELSARDLLELSTPVTAQASAPAAQDIAKTFAAKFPSEGAAAATRNAGSTNARNAPRMAMIIGGVFAAIAVGSVVRYQSAATDESSQATSTARVEASISDEEPAAATEQAPVRITNSFDKSEVFEFPPGTSESEARAAVADLLLQRATERMN
jgi:hypothetical protein